MATGTNRTSPQIAGSTSTNRTMIQVIEIDSDSFVLQITMDEGCLAILQSVSVFDELYQSIPSNVSIINNNNFTYTVKIDFISPIVEKVITFILKWDLSAYNGGVTVKLDLENTSLPLHKQFKAELTKLNKLILKTLPAKRATIQPAIVTPNYVNVDVFTYRLKKG
jgi:hypothetical protein